MKYRVTGYYNNWYSLTVEAETADDAREMFMSDNYAEEKEFIDAGPWIACEVLPENEGKCQEVRACS